MTMPWMPIVFECKQCKMDLTTIRSKNIPDVCMYCAKECIMGVMEAQKWQWLEVKLKYERWERLFE